MVYLEIGALLFLSFGLYDGGGGGELSLASKCITLKQLILFGCWLSEGLVFSLLIMS